LTWKEIAGTAQDRTVSVDPLLSPEATILKVSNKNYDLWVGPTPEALDSWTSLQI